MCGNCYPDDIIVCPSCKRDDEAFKLGEADSPFADLGSGIFKCLCGDTFSRAEQSLHEITAEQTGQ